MTKNNPWASIDPSVDSKRCQPDHRFDFFWSLGKYSEYLLVIEHKRLEDWSAKKLNLSGIEIEQYQTSNGYRLVLKLNDNSDWDIFLNLCIDLIQATEGIDNQKAMLGVVYNRLQRWQKLFRKTGKKLLTADEQQGLVGELYFIKQHLLNRYGEAEVFSFWRGPYGEQQDFGIGKTTVEVKTKRGTAIPYVQINSADQLECGTEYCFLYVVTLNASPAITEEAFTLNEIVFEIKKKIISADILDLFESLLAEAGYIEMPEYSENYYLISRESAYAIRDNFPRIHTNDLSDGVHSVQYKIELNVCKPYEIEISLLDARILNE